MSNPALARRARFPGDPYGQAQPKDLHKKAEDEAKKRLRGIFRC